jgi:MFS family permease
MFSWGAITIGLGGVHSYAAVTVVRFLLGVFEAGLFPGLVYYLSESLLPSAGPSLIGFLQLSGTVPTSEASALPSS